MYTTERTSYCSEPLITFWAHMRAMFYALKHIFTKYNAQVEI